MATATAAKYLKKIDKSVRVNFQTSNKTYDNCGKKSQFFRNRAFKKYRVKNWGFLTWQIGRAFQRKIRCLICFNCSSIEQKNRICVLREKNSKNPFYKTEIFDRRTYCSGLIFSNPLIILKTFSTIYQQYLITFRHRCVLRSRQNTL